jgi:hypothetical protein
MLNDAKKILGSMVGRVALKKNSLLTLLYALIFGGVLIRTFSHFNNTIEDAWISFKYAVNLAQGYGLVSNRGGIPQEGYSNFFLVLLLALFKKIFGLDVVLMSKAIGIASVFGVMLVSYFMLKLFFKELGKSAEVVENLSYFNRHKELYFHFVNIGTILCLAFSNYFIIWSTQGLETILYSFVVMSVLYSSLYALIEKKPHYLYIASVLSFISLNTRPEGLMNFFLVIGLCLIYFILQKKADPVVVRSLIISSLMYAMMVAALFLFKYLYFGDIIANPTHIKLAFSAWGVEWPYILQYFNYILRYFADKGLLFSLIFFLSLLLSAIYGLPILFRKTRSDLAGPYFIIVGVVVFILSQLFYAWYSSGDYMHNFRFIVTHYPLFILLSYFILIYGLVLFKAGRSGIILLFLVTLILLQSAYKEPLIIVSKPSEARAVLKLRNIMEKHKNDYYETSEFGYIPYHAIDLKGLDMIGLNQKDVAKNYKIYPVHDAIYASRDLLLSKKPFIILIDRLFYDVKGKKVDIDPEIEWFFKPYYDSEFFRKNYNADMPNRRSGKSEYTFFEWNGRYRSADKIYWDDPADRDKLMYGFDLKEGKMWIGPLARVLIKPKKGDANIILEGEIPSFDEGEKTNLIIELKVNGKATGDLSVGRTLIGRAGGFRARFPLPEKLLSEGEDILLTLTARQSISNKNNQEIRGASYIFRSIYFSDR